MSLHNNYTNYLYPEVQLTPIPPGADVFHAAPQGIVFFQVGKCIKDTSVKFT